VVVASKERKGRGKNMYWPNLRFYRRIYLQRLRNTTTTAAIWEERLKEGRKNVKDKRSKIG
jgi:hypothetical protein